VAELNHQRSLVTLLQKVCAGRGIRLTSFSGDWIFCLQKEERIAYIFGYDFGINNAAAKMICQDKAATSDLLDFHAVPHIEHRIFHGPQLASYVPPQGTWREMLAYFDAHPAGLVCKPNEGTGGNGVFLARSVPQLEAAVYQILARNQSLCLSPFEDFEHEYRVALLCGQVQFIYRKVRPAVSGDGRRSLRELLLADLRETRDFAKQVANMKWLPEMKVNWDRVPGAGESVKINWRHNLGQGSKPELLSPEDGPWQACADLALAASHALGVELASVDIAGTSAGLKVLEINSGIMMEALVKTLPGGPALATQFYDRIICRMLGIGLEQ